MGGVPKQRKTKSRQANRRMHLFIKGAALTKCPKCAKPVLPHTVCQNCGYYKGTLIIDVMKKLTKKERKQKEKEIKPHGE
ncbi:MAG: 50S ribosomal protein L32 [Candidatus Nealsonbacteria bacterium]|nr:50S ribosomal protein L32 [Candidatus Nealsonbacteria bacterium]